MGRASRARKKSNKTSTKRTSLKDLVEAAEDCAARCDFEQALLWYQKALAQDPESTGLMDAAGEVLLELGQVDQARDLLTQSVQAAPTASYCPYMYLAQLSQGPDSLACYERGLNLLVEEINRTPDPEAQMMLRVKLAEGLCGKAELYMTDLCDMPNAETECQQALEAALQSDPANVDVLLTAANLCVCQQNRDQAMQHLDRAAELLSNLEDDKRPPVEVCMTCAKMYVELEEHDKAIEQLEEVLVDDDELTEAHFMLAAEHKCLGNLERARECVARAHGLYTNDPEAVPEIMQKIVELGQSLAEEV
eukprot:TRINITY_DN43438_c0_g1_i6.p1 TRINITY_DN43438_c0_g1~~TRINITY_DN43438_c0_g1_i6.p1  ORF type:complete len:307 (+),score=86.34 TRINITY_DN43438_c0_g1_i6:165-1085(+)